MRARWTLVVVLMVALVGAALAVPAFTTHGNPCTKYANAYGGNDANDGDDGEAVKTVARLVQVLGTNAVGCLRGYGENAEPSNAGLYEGNVTIGTAKAGITLRSYPHEVAQIKGRLQIQAPNVTVSHLVLDGRNGTGLASPNITATADGARLIDNDITTRNTAHCVSAIGALGAEVVGVEIRHNRIHDCKNAVSLNYTGDAEGNGAQVAQNLIFDNAGAGVRIATGSDYSNVTGNVIDRNADSVVFGGGTDSNDVSVNVIANPSTWNLTFLSQPGNGNWFSSNCVWKPGGQSGVNDAAYTSETEQPNKVTLYDVLPPADPLYRGAESESDYGITGDSGCHTTTGDMSYAVGHGERPKSAQAVNLRPNILFIVTDDQRADTMDMGVMTETLKWMKEGTEVGGAYGGVRGGQRYNQAFATTPLCCPSRASILSGRYAHNHGVWRNQDGSLLDSATLLPAYLKELGYYNAMYGKYLNGWQSCTVDGADSVGQQHLDAPGADPGTPPNFDDFSVFQQAYLDFYAVEPSPGRDKCVHKPSPHHTTAYTFGQGEELLAAKEVSGDSQPWFMYLATTAPHELPTGADNHEQWAGMTAGTPHVGANVHGYTPPDGFTGPYKPRRHWDSKLVLEHRNENGVVTNPGLQKQQLRALKFVDDELDSFMSELENAREADDTLTFFIADNGYMWREFEKEPDNPQAETHPDCNTPTSSSTPGAANPRCGMTGKNWPYLPSIKIPFLMRWPDNPAVQADGPDSNRLVATIDLAATAMDAVDATPPAQAPPFDGRSLLGSHTRPWMLTEFHADQDWNSVVNTDRHFIQYMAWTKPISSLTNNGGLVQVNTPKPHGLATGDTVLISDSHAPANGTWTITVTGEQSFTINQPHQGSGTGTYVATRPIASLTDSSGLIQVNTPQPHNLATGDAVRISGSHASANTMPGATWTITKTGDYSFTINQQYQGTGTGTYTALQTYHRQLYVLQADPLLGPADPAEHNNLYGLGEQPGGQTPDPSPAPYVDEVVRYANCKGSACP